MNNSGLMKSFSQEKDELNFTKILNELSIVYQVIDDYENLLKENSNKSYLEDLTEGKFQFVIIHHIQKDTKDRRVLNILKKKTNDNDLKNYALDCMKETGSFEYTRKFIKNCILNINKEIDDLGFLLN
jgi:geranylgeranyl diphosphate synthase, type III